MRKARRKMNVIKLLKSIFKRNKKKPIKPYVEKDTYCDLCKYSYDCDKRLEITKLNDTRRHFVPVMGALCKAMELDE